MLLAAAALALAAAAPSADARPRLRCSSGSTLLVNGQLRIFSVAFRDDDESGTDHYACLEGHGRPLWVGQDGEGPGVGLERMLAYSFAGGRYLLSALYAESEGGPSGDYMIFDLRAGKRISSTALNIGEIEADFAFVADGRMVKADDQVVELHRPRVGSRKLSTPGVIAGDLALSGTTLYWTESPEGAPPVVRSAPLGGDPGPAGDRLAPVGLHRGGSCTRRSGTTVLQSSRVRVLRRGARVLACRFGDALAVGLPADSTDLRVVADRWLFLRSGTRARVIDMRSRRTVTQADAPVESTLLDNGTLAWIEAGGRLLAATPGAALHELAASGASALASSRTTVYWTAAAAPQRFQPSGARPRD